MLHVALDLLLFMLYYSVSHLFVGCAILPEQVLIPTTDQSAEAFPRNVRSLEGAFMYLCIYGSYGDALSYYCFSY